MIPNVIPLIEADYFPYLYDKIAQANKSIQAIIYYSKIHHRRKNDDVSNLFHLLGRKHTSGIPVSVLFNMSSRKNFLTRANAEVATSLMSQGVLCRHSDTNRVSHVKLFLIDDNITFLGSHNLSTKAFHSNREISLCVESPQLHDKLRFYFNTQFAEASDKW